MSFLIVMTALSMILLSAPSSAQATLPATITSGYTTCHSSRDDWCAVPLSGTNLSVDSMASSASLAGNVTTVFIAEQLTFSGTLRIDCQTGTPNGYGAPLIVSVINASKSPGATINTYFAVKGTLASGSSISITNGTYQYSTDGAALLYLNGGITLNTASHISITGAIVKHQDFTIGGGVAVSFSTVYADGPVTTSGSSSLRVNNNVFVLTNMSNSNAWKWYQFYVNTASITISDNSTVSFSANQYNISNLVGGWTWGWYGVYAAATDITLSNTATFDFSFNTFTLWNIVQTSSWSWYPFYAPDKSITVATNSKLSASHNSHAMTSITASNALYWYYFVTGKSLTVAGNSTISLSHNSYTLSNFRAGFSWRWYQLYAAAAPITINTGGIVAASFNTYLLVNVSTSGDWLWFFCYLNGKPMVANQGTIMLSNNRYTLINATAAGDWSWNHIFSRNSGINLASKSLLDSSTNTFLVTNVTTLSCVWQQHFFQSSPLTVTNSNYSLTHNTFTLSQLITTSAPWIWRQFSSDVSSPVVFATNSTWDITHNRFEGPVGSRVPTTSSTLLLEVTSTLQVSLNSSIAITYNRVNAKNSSKLLYVSNIIGDVVTIETCKNFANASRCVTRIDGTNDCFSGAVSIFAFDCHRSNTTTISESTTLINSVSKTLEPSPTHTISMQRTQTLQLNSTLAPTTTTTSTPFTSRTCPHVTLTLYHKSNTSLFLLNSNAIDDSLVRDGRLVVNVSLNGFGFTFRDEMPNKLSFGVDSIGVQDPRSFPAVVNTGGIKCELAPSSSRQFIMCFFPPSPDYTLRASETLVLRGGGTGVSPPCTDIPWTLGSIQVQPTKRDTLQQVFQVTSTVATGVATTVVMLLADGTPIEIQVMVALLNSACASDVDRDSVIYVRYFISPVDHLGWWWVIVVNVCIAVGCAAIHAGLVGVLFLRRLRSNHRDIFSEKSDYIPHKWLIFRNVSSTLLFPGFPLLVCHMMYIGVAMGTFDVLSSIQGATASVSIIGIVFMVAVPAADAYLLHSIIDANYSPYQLDGTSVYLRWLFPKGKWEPEAEVRRLFGVIGPFRIGFRYGILTSVGLAVIIALVMYGLNSVTPCDYLFIVSAIVLCLFGVTFVAVRPTKSAAHSLLTAACLFGVGGLSALQIVAIRANTDSIESAKSSLNYIVVSLVILRSAHSIWTFFFEKKQNVHETSTPSAHQQQYIHSERVKDPPSEVDDKHSIGVCETQNGVHADTEYYNAIAPLSRAQSNGSHCMGVESPYSESEHGELISRQPSTLSRQGNLQQPHASRTGSQLCFLGQEGQPTSPFFRRVSTTTGKLFSRTSSSHQKTPRMTPTSKQSLDNYM